MRIHRWLLWLVGTALLIAVLLLPVMRQSEDVQLPSGPHFAVIIPTRESEYLDMEALSDSIAQEYGIALELHSFTTLADQKSMLSLLSNTDVDGVLLWPLSVNDRDFSEELGALKEAEIPVVVMERDVAASLRNSFVGGGFTSNLLVLNQTLKSLPRNEDFMVGNLSGSGAGQTAELLFFEKSAEPQTLDEAPRDKLLLQMAQNPPEGYQPVKLLRFTEKDAQPLYLKYHLISMFSQEDAPDLVFSLNETLSGTVIAAQQSNAISEEGRRSYLICYAEGGRYQDSLESGAADALVTSRPDVSLYIGLRYLRDIHRGFWVPSVMDSGILLQESREKEAVHE